MVIDDSNGRGVNIADTTGGASRVVGGAEDVASGVGTIEGAVGAGGMISVGISTCCAYDDCSSYGGSGRVGISGAPRGAT